MSIKSVTRRKASTRPVKAPPRAEPPATAESSVDAVSQPAEWLDLAPEIMPDGLRESVMAERLAQTGRDVYETARSAMTAALGASDPATDPDGSILAASRLLAWERIRTLIPSPVPVSPELERDLIVRITAVTRQWLMRQLPPEPRFAAELDHKTREHARDETGPWPCAEDLTACEAYAGMIAAATAFNTLCSQLLVPAGSTSVENRVRSYAAVRAEAGRIEASSVEVAGLVELADQARAKSGLSHACGHGVLPVPGRSVGRPGSFDWKE